MDFTLCRKIRIFLSLQQMFAPYRSSDQVTEDSLVKSMHACDCAGMNTSSPCEVILHYTARLFNTCISDIKHVYYFSLLPQADPGLHVQRLA